MRKWLIALIALAFVVVFTLPATAVPRASPIALVGEMMLMPTAMGTSHHQTFLDLTTARIQVIQVIQTREIGILPLSFAPVAFHNTMRQPTMRQPTLATMEQRHDAAYHTLNWTTMMSAALRMEDAFTVGVSPILRL